MTASDGGNPSHNSTAVVIINEHKARANETGNELRTQIMTNATEQRYSKTANSREKNASHLDPKFLGQMLE